MKKKYHLSKCSKYDRSLILRYLKHHAYKIELWQKGFKEGEIEHYEVDKATDNENILVIQKIGTFIKKATPSKLKNGLSYFKVTIGRRSYCGKVNFTHQENSKYLLEINSPIYAFDQRENFRLPSNDFISVRVKFEEKKFDAIDVSGKSICMIVDSKDVPLFPVGRTLATMRFVINDDLFIIPHFRVISLREILSPEGKTTQKFKVVCLFSRLPKHQQQEIVKVVESYARKLTLES